MKKTSIKFTGIFIELFSFNWVKIALKGISCYLVSAVSWCRECNFLFIGHWTEGDITISQGSFVIDEKRFFVKNYLWFSPPDTIFLFNEIVFLMVKDCLQSNNKTNSISVYDIHAKVLIRWFIYRGIPPWNTKNLSLPNQTKTICKWLVIIFSINGYTSNQLYINILF